MRSPAASPAMGGTALGWIGIVQLGLVQAAIGSVVVLATSTLNRIMVVELALPAVFPGLLVALHYAVQMVRTRIGHGSDGGGRLGRWIIGGMLVLVAGAVGAASAVALMATHRTEGMIAAIVAYTVIGVGVGACGTSLLVLLARTVAAERRPAAATITWVMMFVGFVITTAIAGQFLDPYTHSRLIALVAMVSIADLVITCIAVWSFEARWAGACAESRIHRDIGAAVISDSVRTATASLPVSTGKARFGVALAQVWHERAARHFTIFVFVSMLAYSGQELLLEPFVARVFALSPGQSARIASLQHAGALAGMIVVAVIGTLWMKRRIARKQTASMQDWTVGGCVASAVALLVLSFSTFDPVNWPLRANIFVLGIANGVFAVSAIGSMMSLMSSGDPERRGLRMGLWGAAQAVAFAFGGAVSSAAVDIATELLDSRAPAYATVFAAQALLFIIASVLAGRAYSGDVQWPSGLRTSSMS